jgi:hypothetical protein
MFLNGHGQLGTIVSRWITMTRKQDHFFIVKFEQIILELENLD